MNVQSISCPKDMISLCIGMSTNSPVTFLR